MEWLSKTQYSTQNKSSQNVEKVRMPERDFGTTFGFLIQREKKASVLKLG